MSEHDMTHALYVIDDPTAGELGLVRDTDEPGWVTQRPTTKEDAQKRMWALQVAGYEVSLADDDHGTWIYVR